MFVYTFIYEYMWVLLCLLTALATHNIFNDRWSLLYFTQSYKLLASIETRMCRGTYKNSFWCTNNYRKRSGNKWRAEHIELMEQTLLQPVVYMKSPNTANPNTEHANRCPWSKRSISRLIRMSNSGCSLEVTRTISLSAELFRYSGEKQARKPESPLFSILLERDLSQQWDWIRFL